MLRRGGPAAAAPAGAHRLHRNIPGTAEGGGPVKNIEKLVIATHNSGKLREIRELLAPLGIECVSAVELGLPEPEEIGNTFIDNADLKAREAADLSGLPALADDSGLAVDALHGRPGIYSARWAEDSEGNRDWMRAMS